MTKVLVTGVGGGVGQSIIKCFQNSPYSVIGADGETLGTGLYAVPKAYKIPYASNPAYIQTVLNICKTEGCSLIFPGLDAELPVLSRHTNLFRQQGIIPVVSSQDVINISDDKLATYQFLINQGFDAPSTVELSEENVSDIGFPLVLKPRKGGARSSGVYVLQDKGELSSKLSTIDLKNYVAQEFIKGDEYTCGSVCFEGICYGPIVMRRILRDGDTYKAFVVQDPNIQAYVRRIAECLRPFGACNFQLRVNNSRVYVFEINARCSGTTYARSLAGFNEPLMIANYLLYGKDPMYDIRNISILRYWKELVVENSRIEILEQTGVVDGDGSQL